MYVNRIDRINIPDFIEAWDRGYASVDNIQIKRSKEGNLNSLGDPLSSFAPVVTKHHPLFFNFVEEGIQALAKKIVIDFNCITFSSCQGHPAYRTHGGFSALRPRGLSILPRNNAELQEICKKLKRVCDQTNTEMASEYVVVEVKKERLEVRNNGYTKYWQSIDLTFIPLVNASASYFDVIGEIYQAFLKNLSNSVTM